MIRRIEVGILLFASVQGWLIQRKSYQPSNTRLHQELRQLPPVRAPAKTFDLPVDDIHTIHVELYSGTHSSKVALFLHGGPGAGCTPNHARFLKCRAVLLDQRGSGKSTPRGELRNNTLMDTVSDCEKVREYLGLEYWDILLGGSWGSTVALAYAQTYPRRVKSMILRGVCTLRPCEVNWLWGGGSVSLASNKWNEIRSFLKVTDSDEEQNPRAVLLAIYQQLCCKAPTREAIGTWMQWEYIIGSSYKNESHFANIPERTLVWASTNSDRQAIDTLKSLRVGLLDKEKDFNEQIEAHQSTVIEARMSTANQTERLGDQSLVSPIFTCYYSTNERYCTNNLRLLDRDRCHRLKNIPCIAVHGGQDRVCPIDTALELKAVYPTMELRVPLRGGHSMYDDYIRHEIIKAVDDILNKL